MSTAPRILVVDDHQDNLDLLTVMLRSKGYIVAQATNGQRALESVRQSPPDLLMLDVMMPGLNGLEVTQIIRNDPNLPFIPIMLITAQHDLDDKVDGLDAGADDFLTKPVQMRELLAKLRALLRLKQAHTALLDERNKTTLLYRIQQQLTSSLDIDEVVSQTVRLMVEAVHAGQGSIIVFDPHGKVWRRTLARQGLSATESEHVSALVLEEGLGGLAIKTRQPQFVADTLHDERWIKLPNDDLVVRSAIALPLYFANTILGVLTLTHAEPCHFSETQLDLLNTAASQISIAQRNASLYSLLREAEAGREQFLHMLTHDLRAPLAGIAGCLHMLGLTASESDHKLFVEMAQMACTTQERLIDDILDVYRAESGHMELQCTCVDLGALGDEVATSLRGAAAEHALELTIDLGNTPPLIADHDKLLRVLLNLVSNAIKFTRTGGVYVTACVAEADLRVTVRDTGYGIPTDQLDQIFDRFFQGNQRGARRGTGLGLTFCREVIVAHGGQIWAESSVTQGTAIHFTLPLQKEAL